MQPTACAVWKEVKATVSFSLAHLKTLTLFVFRRVSRARRPVVLARHARDAGTRHEEWR
jgi:hypothetical protein